MNKYKNNNFQKRNKPKHILNDRIRYKEIRLISDMSEPIVTSIDKAKSLAKEKGLDLMLVSDKANPPVVRLCDYKKFLYKEKKKKEEQLKNNKKNNKTMKEMRFTPNISDHDVEVKLSKVKEFLKDGHKVKLEVRKIFGRNADYKREESKKLLLSIAVKLEDIAVPNGLPKGNGSMMSMIVNPK
jgi:translation initiation factor IF-3